MISRNAFRVMLVVALVVAFAFAGSAIAAKPVLNHLGSFDNFDPNSDAVGKAIEEVTGYEVKYHMLPAENANEVLALRISTPGQYDSVKLNVGQYEMLVANGALMPLDDLLQKHGQRILEVISEDSWEASKVNGKIYGIPEKNSSDNVNMSIAVRKDVLDDLGLAVPTTLDEFYTVLKAIKDNTDLIPLTLYEAEYFVETILSAFGMATQWTDIDGKLVNRVEHPNMKAYVEFMTKLYAEGLIDPDFPVNNSQKTMEKFTSGRAAMMRFAWWNAPGAIPAITENVPGAEVAYIQPLIGPNGEQGIQVDRGISWYIGIPMGAKNPEDAIKWINAKFDFEGFRYMALGKEGEHFTEKDGKFFPILPKFFDERNNASWYLTGIDETWYPKYWQARVRKDKNMSESYDEIMKALNVCARYNPLSFAPAMPTASQYTQSLGVLTHDYVINFVAGEESLDNFDDFVEDWSDQGGEASTEEINEWYQNK